MLQVLVLAAVCTLPPAEDNAVRADYAAQPDKNFTRYVTLAPLPEMWQPTWDSGIKYQIPSASREIALDYQIPRLVPGTSTYRINLRSLGWDYNDWIKVLEKYPYREYPPDYYANQKNYVYNPLVIRADWLFYVLADTRDNDAYYRLLYGGKNIPKTSDEFLKFWGVDEKVQAAQAFGWVETKSQVAKQDSRFIRHFASGKYLTSVWLTQDVNKITRESDPLEELEGNFKHDGREFIAQFPKVGAGVRGAAQAYGLANGQGAVVNEAPVRLVEDYKRTGGQTAIINNSSCVTCHEQGMQLPNENGLAALIKGGVELQAYDKGKAELIEAFHLGDVGKQLRRNNEDFQEFVKGCNGLTAPENAKTYAWCLSDYVDTLDLLRAAAEVYTDKETLSLAIAYASERKVKVGARLSALAQVGRPIPRTVFEEQYPYILQWIKEFEAK